MSIIKNPLISYLCECPSFFLQAATCTEWQQDFALGQKACSSIPHLMNTSLRQTAAGKRVERKIRKSKKKVLTDELKLFSTRVQPEQAPAFRWDCH